MKKIYDVCIIGGGASGCACGIKCTNNNLSVLILEKENRLAKKVLATGNGRCNLTNINIRDTFYNSPFVYEIIKKYGVKEILSFFKSIGVECYADNEGRFYPLSNSAADVASALVTALHNCDCRTNCEVFRIIKAGSKFVINSAGGKFFAKNVVCACGGMCPSLFQKIHHNSLEKKEVLAPLLCDENYNKNLFGVRQNAVVSCSIKNKTFCEDGQVQFRKDGISGIIIFNLSAFIHANGSFPIKITIDLLPDLPWGKIKSMLEARNNNPLIPPHNILHSVLPNALAKEVLKNCGLTNFAQNNLSENDIENIVEAIKNFTVTAINTSSAGQVTSGGFDLAQFTRLESNLQKGIYACGESTGVFGYCGGYNLHFAWASGLFVADEITKKL